MIKTLDELAKDYFDFGANDMDQFIHNQIKEEADYSDDDDIINAYNDYLKESRYNEFLPNDEDTFNDLFNTPMEAVLAVLHGDYEENDDYIRFNGYDNIVSYSSSEAKDEALDDSNFIDWLKDNYDNWDDLADLIELLNDEENQEYIKNKASEYKE